MALSRAYVHALLGSVIRACGGAPARRDASDWRKTTRARLLVCAAALGVWTAGIEARLVYLQVFEHADLMTRADRQQTRTLFPPAKRGEIFDRSGRLLAYRGVSNVAGPRGEVLQVEIAYHYPGEGDGP